MLYITLISDEISEKKLNNDNNDIMLSTQKRNSWKHLRMSPSVFLYISRQFGTSRDLDQTLAHTHNHIDMYILFSSQNGVKTHTRNYIEILCLFSIKRVFTL